MFCLCCRPTPGGFVADATSTQAADIDAAMARRSAYQRRKSFSAAPVTHPEPTEFIIRNACVRTMDPHTGDVPNGDIHVRDGLIVDIGHALKSSALHEIDGRGAIALPGFIATHRHLLSEALACHAAPIDTADAEAADIYCLLRLTMLDAMSSGITSLHHCGYDLDPVFAETAIMAQLDVGLHGRFSYPVGFDRPDAKIPEEAAELAQRWCSSSDDALLAFGLACKAGDAAALEHLALPWPVTADHHPVQSHSFAGRTRDAAREMEFDDDVGSLGPGKRADLILIAVDDASIPQQAMKNAHDVPPAAVRLVAIDGRLRKRNGVLTEPNESLIRREGRAAQARLRAVQSKPIGVLLQ